MLKCPSNPARARRLRDPASPAPPRSSCLLLWGWVAAPRAASFESCWRELCSVYVKPNTELVLAAGSHGCPYLCSNSRNFFLEELTLLRPWLCKPREPGCCSRLLRAV